MNNFYKKIQPMLPLTQHTINTDAETWLRIIKYKESGTIIQFQDDCEYRMEDIITNTVRKKAILGPKHRRYLLGYISLGTKELLPQIRKTVFELCAKYGIQLEDHIGEDLIELFAYLKQNNYHIGLFVFNTRSLLENEMNYQELYDLEMFIKTSQSLSVVFFSEFDLTNPHYTALVDNASSLFQNTLLYPLYKHDDVDQFITYKCTSWDIDLNESMRDIIKRTCGGYLWFISHVLRLIRDDKTVALENVWNDTMLIHKITTTWNKLSDSEKDILRKVHFQSLLNNDLQTHEYKYLVSTGFIRHDNPSTQAQLTVPLFKYVITVDRPKCGVQFKNEKLYYNEKDHTEYFSDSELSVLKTLIENPGEIISRDVIAQAIWGNYWQRRYSDWSIDSTIYRIRNKVKHIGLNKSSIITIKSRGFKFEE